MTNANDGTLTLVIEQEIPAEQDLVWRALTDSDLIEQWLMPNNFQPKVGQPFNLMGDWGTVECKVIQIVPTELLVYTWSAYGLDSTVSYFLKPSAVGTTIRVEQAGFKAEQQQFYEGAKGGWQQFLANLEKVVASLA